MIVSAQKEKLSGFRNVSECASFCFLAVFYTNLKGKRGLCSGLQVDVAIK